MAIQFQGNNIIKMYYGGNAITQAWLNGDYFLPISNEYVEFEEGTATCIDRTTTINFSFEPYFIELWLQDVNETEQLYMSNLFQDSIFNDENNTSIYGAGSEIYSWTWQGFESFRYLDGSTFSQTNPPYDNTIRYKAWGKTLNSNTSGKKYATGTTSYDTTNGNIVVSGLDFIPKLIIIKTPSNGTGKQLFTYSVEHIPQYNSTNTYSGLCIYGNSGSLDKIYSTGYDDRENVQVFNVNNSGFTFISPYPQDELYTWEVWGDDNLFNAYTATITNGDTATAAIIDSTNISTTTSGYWSVIHCTISGLTPNETYRLTTNIENPSGMYGGVRDKSSSSGGYQKCFKTDTSFECAVVLQADSTGAIYFEFYPNYTDSSTIGTMTFNNIKLVQDNNLFNTYGLGEWWTNNVTYSYNNDTSITVSYDGTINVESKDLAWHVYNLDSTKTYTFTADITFTASSEVTEYITGVISLLQSSNTDIEYGSKELTLIEETGKTLTDNVYFTFTPIENKAVLYMYFYANNNKNISFDYTLNNIKLVEA